MNVRKDTKPLSASLGSCGASTLAAKAHFVARASVTKAEEVDMSVKVRGRDAGSFVDLLYRGFLRRPPDPAGYEAAVNALSRGLPPLELMMNFLQSEEYGVLSASPRLTEAVPTLDWLDYEPAADVDLHRFSQEPVASASERLRTTMVFSRDQFQAAMNRTLPPFLAEMPNFGGQRDYLNDHFERFYELDNLIGALLEEVPSRHEVVDVGFSANTLIMATLMQNARFTVCDRPGMPLPACYRDSAAMVDLASGALEEEAFAVRADVIVFAEVIEHLLANPIRVLAFLLQQLTDRGRLIITTPNFYRRSVIECMGRRDNPQPVYPIQYGPQDAPHFHVREYAMKELLHFVELAGGFTEAFYYSSCWDDEAARMQTPPHEWANMVVVVGRC